MKATVTTCAHSIVLIKNISVTRGARVVVGIFNIMFPSYIYYMSIMQEQNIP